ncbi:MAG: radical SAM protein [Dehalogenimonas sp.]|jgi:radical SAM protein with 4Fe4S-binding SPASM domain|uniref:Radical SAM protein n=1 Tax=Candidatus Dehalogenimonas loeffleri TaxID=3127115 RepID=A0ABZ2J237_9CHLR|nr:radical SAM protein [Dehalogenimonas sp.]
MISISRLLCDNIGPQDSLRYSPNANADGQPKPFQPPIVVWNCTRACNLHCIHCYASATNNCSPDEISTDEAKTFIKGLADFGVPVILFSGGEPLMRRDLFELADFARAHGIRVALSTNGTLIDREMAVRIQNAGFAEVGISLDGIGENNDKFRVQPGAFEAALTGIRHCVDLKQRVSLRLTITGHNHKEIPAMLDLIEEENIPRVCFYHLAYTGRGDKIIKDDLTHAETRAAVDVICDRTIDWHKRGIAKEILTVDNAADGVYLYLRARLTDPERAETIYSLLKRNGGNSSGIKIGAIDDRGNVHPDQFTWHHTFGNIRERKFGDIWMDTSHPLLAALKDRKKVLSGRRCPQCRYLEVCNGNLRVRAESVSGDYWEDDPACYLSDEEIGIIA